jgi:hypothetical protein
MISLHSVMVDLPAGSDGQWLGSRTERKEPARVPSHDARGRLGFACIGNFHFRQWNPFFARFVYGLMDTNFFARPVMNDDTNSGDATEPGTLSAAKEWSNWKRRSFVALLCLLELALVTVLVYGAIVLWRMLDF